MTIELALTPDSRWGLDASALATLAREAGFSAVGLGVAQADEEAAASLAVNGVRCHELLAFILGRDEEANLRHAARLGRSSRRRRSRMGPDDIRRAANQRLRVSHRGGSQPCSQRPVRRWRRSSVRSAKSPRFQPLLAVVEAAGVDRAGVLIDSWHFFRGDSTWENLETVPLERIAYVQFDGTRPRPCPMTPSMRP